MITICIALWCCASSALAQTYQGLLWKISGNGLEKPSYLMGSMHVSNKVAFHLSDSFYKAIESVDMVALEINADTWMETMSTNPYVAKRMVSSFLVGKDYPEDGFYKSIFKLKKHNNRELGELIGQELGIINSLLYRNNGSNQEFQEDTYLDLFIFQAGKKLGKRVTGLEELGGTMRLNEMINKPEKNLANKKAWIKEKEKNRFLLEKLLKGKSMSEVMEDAYRAGDLDLLDSISKLSSSRKKEHDFIIVYRNKIMAKGIDSILKKNSLFAAIGAAHLANSYGVINLLREMGYILSPVDNKKTDWGTHYKDSLEATFINIPASVQTTFDGKVTLKIPGKLYEFPESDNVMLAAYPDMANGATYTLTRIQTFTPLTRLSTAQYTEKIDSLLFENIPGKIISKSTKRHQNFPSFDIVNKTKKGDFQRYKIIVTPQELYIFKVAGKKNFIEREEVQVFFESIQINTVSPSESTIFSPKNNAYTISLPGTPIFSSEASAFDMGFWSKTVHSYTSDNEIFGVLNRSKADMQYMEEDTFELGQMAKHFCEQYEFEIKSRTVGNFEKYYSLDLMAVRAYNDTLFAKLIAKDKHYYLLFAKSSAPRATTFFESFKLNSYRYTTPYTWQDDSLSFYKVKSLTEPMPQNDYSSDYGLTNEDKSHEEQQNITIYYHLNTDELVYVKMNKYHRYEYKQSIDSIWNACEKELSGGGNFYLFDKQKNGNTYSLKASDTNTNRCLYGKYILHQGVRYALYSEIDQHLPISAFIDTFYSTFTPWDTIQELSILQAKGNIFLSDLRSADSTRKKQAVQSLGVINFADKEAPLVIDAIKSWNNGEDNVKIRVALLEKLGKLNHASVLPFLEKYYAQINDTTVLQLPILEAILSKKTKKTTRLYLKLLEQEPPLSKNSNEFYRLFKVFDDSLLLAKEIYPELIKFASLPEYKFRTFKYLSRLKDSGLIKPKVYKKALSKIVWEASNDLKRQKSEEAHHNEKYYNDASRYTMYNYNYSLYHYANLLLPFERKNTKIKTFFSRLNELSSPGLQMDILALKAKNGYLVPEEKWEGFARNDNHRYKLLLSLEEQKMVGEFPKKYASQHLMAISIFAEKNELNVFRDSVQWVGKYLTHTPKDTGYTYFFRVKRKDNSSWQMGYIGLLPLDTTSLKFDVKLYDDDMEFSEYEDQELQIKRQLLELEMAHRKRYDVLDEKEFEPLKSKKMKFGY